MTQYALAYVEYEGSVLLIEKQKPAWQKGLFNLPGGKIEDGETALEAAVRELFEEANLQAISGHAIGRITGPDWDVYVVRCRTEHPNRLHQKTDERVFWCRVREAMREERLIDNLRIIIPLCSNGISGWTVYQGPHLSEDQYIVEFPCEFQLI